MHPVIIGHRGAPGYLPEHTESSYRLALEAGVDAVEPDVVATRDGVLVIRHENEISETTDVADRPEFAHLRTTKEFLGHRFEGWFTEDFTWAELSTLRCRERIPQVRPGSAEHDGEEPILRLADLFALVDEAAAAQGRQIGIVLEIKHAAYFAAIGLDLAPLIERDVRTAGWWGSAALTVESFEPTVLLQLRERGVPATYVQLFEHEGAPPDLLLADGAAAPSYAGLRGPAGLDLLRDTVDGISVDKRTILAPDVAGRATGPGSLVRDAHDRDLRVFVWTCRPENRFLIRQFRRGGGPAAFGDYPGEWGLIRDAGVDGVFVDHPDLGIAQFRR